MTEEKKEEVKFTSLDDAMVFLAKGETEAKESVGQYQKHIYEMTGYYPNQPIGPLDVVKIVRKVFGL